jgi:hypothetical protein
MGCGNSKDHPEGSAANGSGESTARAPPPSVDALPNHRRGQAAAASFPAASSSSCGQLPTPEHSGTTDHSDTGRAIGIRRRRHRTPSPASLGRVAERAQSHRAIAAHLRAVQAGLDAVCRARTPPPANPLMSPLPSQHASPEGDARDSADLPALQDAV